MDKGEREERAKFVSSLVELELAFVPLLLVLLHHLCFCPGWLTRSFLAVSVCKRASLSLFHQPNLYTK